MSKTKLFFIIACIGLSSKVVSQNSPFNVNNQTGQSTLNLTSAIGYGGLLKFQRYSSATNYYAFETGAGSNDDLRLYVNGNWSTPIMSFKTDGSIGVGTASPSTKLHVVGIGGSTNIGNSPTSGDFVIQANTGSRSQTAGAQLEFVIPANSDGSNLWGQARILTVAGNSATGNASGKMILGTRRYWQKPGTTGQAWYYGDDLVIDQSGNVGIGTTNPNQKLTVNGTIYGKEVKVDLNVPGPDYVFATNYQLQPLNELKTYIDQNKHLPEVPSAKEMEANGINLGDEYAIIKEGGGVDLVCD